MSIASTGTSTGHLAWWRASKPDWIWEPDGDEFYGYVRNLRALPLETRKESINVIVSKYRVETEGDEMDGVETPTDMDLWFYGFWLAVEAGVFLDKKRGGKFLTMFKDFTNFEKPRKLLVVAGGRLGELLEAIADPKVLALPGWMEDADAYASVRLVLFPPKAKTLTEEQEKGFKAIEQYEKERKLVEEYFTEYEDKLLGELKTLRSARETVRKEVRQLAPQYDDLKKARATKLTYTQKVEASRKYQKTPDLKNDYTEEGYIALVQDNVARRAEREVYGIFRLSGGIRAVQVAKERAKNLIGRLKRGDVPAPEDESRAATPDRKGGGLTDEDFEIA
jgi:hypothetical protein